MSEQADHTSSRPAGEGAAPHTEPGKSTVTVNYWAAARSAAGVASDTFEIEAGASLADVLDKIYEAHRDRARLVDVLAACSTLIGDQPVGAREPEDVPVNPGDTVELLPPFAGG